MIQGLANDSNEIKVILHMMLFRLAQRLDEATPLPEKLMKCAQTTKEMVKLVSFASFADVLTRGRLHLIVRKDRSVGGFERTAELQRRTLRATAALSESARTA